MSSLKVFNQQRDIELSPTERVTTVKGYQDPTGNFSTGFWGARYGKVDVHYDKDEFCVILEGEVRVTDLDGHAETYGPGDAFIIPCGFKGTWETVKPAKKLFAHHRPAPR
jgi:uncharacterized cupin superfamily protein